MEPMTWDAIATFTTGIFAVGSATVVAMKQVAIVKRQTLLQELALRNEVFDKRMENYRAIRRYVATVSHLTSSDHDSFADFEIYLEALEDARFLFSKRLYLELNALAMLVEEVRKSVQHHEWDGNKPK